jgi:polyisoprenoid-binding protein YceI
MAINRPLPQGMTGIVAGLTLLAAACGSHAGQAPAQIAAPTVAPSSPTPIPTSASTPTQPTSGQADSQPATRSQDDLSITLVPGDSEARFRAREQLAGLSVPSEAVGRTRSVTGDLVLDLTDGSVKGASKIVMEAASLQSDEPIRDRYIKENTLQVSQYPTVEFVARELRGLATPLPTSGDVTLQLVGDLTVHGVTRPATWDVRARINDQDATGTASTQVKITDFGMPLPRVARVLSLEDTLTLEVDFHATSGGAASSASPAPR